MTTQDHIRSQKEGMSGTKHFYWVPTVWNKAISCFISPLFIMFLYEMPTKTSNECEFPSIPKLCLNWGNITVAFPAYSKRLFVASGSANVLTDVPPAENNTQWEK